MNKHNWEGINFPSKKEIIALNVLYAKKENVFTTKVSEHIPLGFSMYTILSFKRIENKMYQLMYKEIKIA